MAWSEAELAWLAGLLEGEGSFLVQTERKAGRVYRYPRVVVTMTDLDVIERAAGMFGRKVFTVPPDPKYPGRKQQWRAVIQGARAADIMRQLRPWMGERRRAKIDEVLAEYDGREPTDIRRARSCSEVAAGRPRDALGRLTSVM